MYWNYTIADIYPAKRLNQELLMAYVIALPCIGVKDGACLAVCPVDCIHPTKTEVGFAEAEQLYIDPVNCIDCNLCVDECPVQAIFPQDDLPAEWKHFIEKNAAHYGK
jgi:ferredoxin